MEGLMSDVADGEWDSCVGIFLNDDAGFMLHQLFNDEVGKGSCSTSVAPASWSSVEHNTNLAEANQSFFHPMGSFFTNSCPLSSHYGFSNHCEVVGVVPSQSHEKYYVTESDDTRQLDNTGFPVQSCMMDVDASTVPSFSDAIGEDPTFLNNLELCQVQPDMLTSVPNSHMSLKRKAENSAFQSAQPDISGAENPTKISRAMKDGSGGKSKTQSKKNLKTSSGGSDDEAIDNSSCKQMSGSYNSEDDSNAGTSSDPKLVTSNDQKGKKTARRGSAIDPQSLYARKRRERINERLRILQNLVPNGTKVDISTMLEEAVHYVKFLQTQIKLLSSDDMWMYAPIAYNGVDIGLDRKVSQIL